MTTSAFGTGSETGTVTVAPGARVDLTSASTYSTAIYFDTVTVNNHGGISTTDTSGFGGSAFGVNGGATTVNNFGTIEAYGDSAFGAAGYSGLTVTNAGTISVVASTGSGVGVSSDGDSVSLTNSGSITAVGAMASGVSAYDTATVTNSGTITVSNASSFGYGVVATTAIVTNSGSITASNNAGGDTYGVYAYHEAVVNNSGVIAVATDGANSVGVFGSRKATVINSGAISAASGAGAAYGVFAGGFSAANVTNIGTITAKSSGAGNAYGVYADNSSTIINNGTIAASSNGGDAYAILIWFGDNTLMLGAGSKLIGTLQLGNIMGPNTISFLGGNHNLTFSPDDLTGASFTGSAIPYAVSGDRAAALDPTSFAASASMLASTTRVIASLAPDFVANDAADKAPSVIAYAPALEPLKLPAGVLAFAPEAPLKSQTVMTADGSAIWTRQFGGRSRDRAEGVLVGYRNSYVGAALGLDRPVDASLRYGAFFGVLSATSELGANYGDTDSTLVFAGAHLRKSWGTSFLKLAVQTGVGSNSSTRNTNNNLATSGVETATASYRNWYVSPELSMGHSFALGRFAQGDLSLTPVAQIRYLHGAFGGYAETGASDALSVGQRMMRNWEERLSMKVSHASTVLQGYGLRLEATGGVIGSQRMGDDSISANLLGQSIQFANPGKANSAAPMAGLSGELTKGALSVFAGGEYIARRNAASDLSGRLGLSVRF